MKTFPLFILILFSTLISAHPFEHPSSWPDPKIISILTTAPINHIEPMGDFLKRQGRHSNFKGKVFIATLAGDIKAVFKPSPLDYQTEAEAEVAAYQASLKLGFPHVPPTVIRNHNKMKGSLQLFVTTPIDLGKAAEFDQIMKDVNKDDLANLQLFYFIFGQWDSDPHNMMAIKDHNKINLIAIDNANIHQAQFVKYGELPFVKMMPAPKLKTNDKGKPFPFDKAETHKIEEIKARYGDKLPPVFYKRFDNLQKKLRYVIYDNAIWRQYNALTKEGFIKPFADYCPPDTLKKIQALDMDSLTKIFTIGQRATFATPAYLRAILARRDQVVAYFTPKKAANDNQPPQIISNAS